MKSRSFRCPVTHNEMKHSVSYLSDEFEPKPRASRSLHNIANAWDDRTRLVQRSWKAFRNTQYK